MFAIQLADGTEWTDVRLKRLHEKLLVYLDEHGYKDQRKLSLTDIYLLSGPRAHRSKRLKQWQEVFSIRKYPHKRRAVYEPVQAEQDT